MQNYLESRPQGQRCSAGCNVVEIVAKEIAWLVRSHAADSARREEKERKNSLQDP